MSDQEHYDLDSVIATDLLDRRASRAPDCDAETHVITELFARLAESPRDFFQTLVDTALKISNANSTGISLLDEEEKKFIWPAIAGGLQPYIGGGTPRSFGPCGTVLDRDATILFLRPDRHFTYLASLTPPPEEALLVPFHLDGKPVGTLWAVIHEPGRHFDAEDKRLLENLSIFAASAYEVLVNEGILETILKKKFLPPNPLAPGAAQRNISI